MAGETIKTRGLVLDIRPWSRTSHVVTWLTPDRGPVTTLVKGAVRPKSAFLGQYDLFYTCELIYYERARGELHAIREASILDAREHLRGDFRATAFASYAAYLVREHCPHSDEAATWFSFLERTLDGGRGGPGLSRAGGVGARPSLRAVVALETEFLALAGLSPDFTGADLSAATVPFAIDLGHAGTGAKTVRLSSGAARLVAARGQETAVAPEEVTVAIRFLGLFLRYHLDLPPDIRRNTLQLLAASGRRMSALRPSERTDDSSWRRSR